MAPLYRNGTWSRIAEPFFLGDMAEPTVLFSRTLFDDTASVRTAFSGYVQSGGRGFLLFLDLQPAIEMASVDSASPKASRRRLRRAAEAGTACGKSAA